MLSERRSGVGSDFDFTDDRALWLSRFILPHEPALRSQLSRWRMPDDLEIDDVIQEAYAKLTMLDDVASIVNPRAYFFQIARSIVWMHVRRSRIVSIQAVERIDELAVASDEPGPDVQVSDRQQLHLLAGLIANLPPTNRAAMTLRLVHDLSHREIGAKLGMSPNAVQKSLAKGLAMFIQILGRGGNNSCQSSTERTPEEQTSDNGAARDQRGN